MISDDSERKRLASILSAGSHGAAGEFVGIGALYYAVAYAIRSRVSVCLGSGGGFVPELLLRAQKDLKLTGAMTYLVDAVIPELGFGSPLQAGGWLNEENDGLRRASGMTILRMLSVDAARLFAADNIAIDYLHIDADHSTHAVVADFESYSPLLSSRAVVSFHDIRLKSVGDALSLIFARYPGWERLSFPDLGAGTCFIRRCNPEGLPQLVTEHGELLDHDDTSRPICLTTASAGDAETLGAANAERARYERWSYLSTTPYRLRYGIAAGYVDRPDSNLIELGGFPNSIAFQLNHVKTLFAIEPYAPAAYVESVEEEARRRQLAFRLIRAPLATAAINEQNLEPYGFVALGLDITAGSNSQEDVRISLHRLVQLLHRAQISVIEYPEYKPSRLTWEFIQRVLAPVVETELLLDFSQDPVAEKYYVKDERAKRHLVVIGHTEMTNRQHYDEMLEKYAALLFMKTHKGETNTPVSYRLGDIIHFQLGGLAEAYQAGGWSVAEKTHTWTLGEESNLLLRLKTTQEPLPPNQPLLLRLSTKVFSSPKHPRQRLTIFVNGERLSDGEFSKPGPTEILCRIPGSVWTQEDVLRIRFVHPDAVSPAQCGMGSDKRVIAFGFITLTIDAVENVHR